MFVAHPNPAAYNFADGQPTTEYATHVHAGIQHTKNCARHFDIACRCATTNNPDTGRQASRPRPSNESDVKQSNSNRGAAVNSGLADTMRRPIVFDGNASPVKNTLFIIVCFAWLIPGLIGHDPWKPDEAMAMGIVHSMLSGLDAWLVPQIAGAANLDYPPLYYWVSALTATLTALVLPAHDGARLASGLFMFVTIFYLYKSANKLFDERAGRVAVALLIGSLGLLLRAHEMNPEVAGMAGMSIALYGLTRIRFEANKGLTVGMGALVMALSVGLLPALVVPAIALTMMVLLHDWQNRAFKRGIVICMVVLLAGAAVYPLILLSMGRLGSAFLIDGILGAPMFDPTSRGAIQPLYILQILPWYALPTLPLAIWLWRKDRKIIRERIELALPLAAFAVALVWVSLFREARDTAAMILLLPLALAAANSLDRLPKGVASFVDWFGLVFFGTAALALWLYWTAAVVGTPSAAAGAVARAAPGFTFTFTWLPVVVAATLTGVWIYAVAMAHRNNRRAVVNWAAGITLLWVLLNLLGLPAVDHVRSYRAPVTEIAGRIKPEGAAASVCVIGLNVGEPQRAMFDYFAALRFTPAKSSAAANCGWLLVQGTKTNAPDIAAPWSLQWEGARPGDKVEQFRLYRRQPS